MSESLRSKTVKGTLWTAFQKFGVMGISFIANMVLAHKLTPDDFGCVAMLAIFLVVSDTFMDGGLGSAIIQKKNLSERDTSTVFFFNLTLGIVLYVVLYICAPFISEFYRTPLLTDVLRVQSLVLIINAFGLVQMSVLRKQMMFKQIAYANIAASIVSIIVALSMAFTGFGIWALVFQQISLTAMRTTLLWVMGHWRPKLLFSSESFRSLFGFGSFIFLSNLINSLCNNAQSVIIGKAFNANMLGYYSQAKKLEELSSTTFSSIIDQVSYPALATKQDDRLGMVMVIRKMLQLIAFVTFPMMISLAIIGYPLIMLCYGEQWLQSVPYFQILCIAGVAICLQSTNYFAVSAIGKSRALFNWTIVKRSITLGLLFLGLIWGIYGLLVAVVIGSYVILLINCLLVQFYLHYTIWAQIKEMLPMAMLTLLAAIPAYLFGYFVDMNIYFEGLCQLVIFYSLYIGSAFTLRMQALQESIDIFQNILRKRD